MSTPEEQQPTPSSPFEGLIQAVFDASDRDRDAVVQATETLMPRELLQAIAAEYSPLLETLATDTAINTSSVDNASRRAIARVVANFDANQDGVLQRDEVIARVDGAIGIINGARVDGENSPLLDIMSQNLISVREQLAELPDNIELQPEVFSAIIDINGDNAITRGEMVEAIGGLPSEILQNLPMLLQDAKENTR